MLEEVSTLLRTMDFESLWLTPLWFPLYSVLEVEDVISPLPALAAYSNALASIMDLLSGTINQNKSSLI